MSALGNKEIMARNIKRYMQKMGISRKDFCERLGFAYSTVTDWLNAEKYPRIDKIEMMANFFGISKADLVEPPASSPAPPAPQKSDGLPELNARDERDIQKRLKSMLDDLDPNAGLAYYNGEEPMDDETRDLIRAALENSLRVAKQIAKAKYTPKKYRKADDTAARIGKKILDASPSAQMAVSQIIDEDKGDEPKNEK